MREFSKISPAVWHSTRFNSLPSDDGRYLYLYLLTNSHQNSAGCYRLPDGYACADLNWTLKRYGDARGQLIKAELICFDPAHSVVLITRWFKHNPPTSEDHVTGIERLLERLPSEELAQMAMEALTESWESIQAAKMQRRDKANATPNGLGRLNTNHLNGRR